MGGSDDKILSQVKYLTRYLPEYKIYLNTRVMNNINDEYVDLTKKGFPLFYADKYNVEGAHFTPDSWITINEISKNLSIPKAFIMHYASAAFYLANTGRIPISIIDPAKKKESEVLKEFAKIGKGAKWMIPLLIGTVAITAIALLKK